MCLNVNLYFERGSLKILKKSNFIFVFKAILFLWKLFRGTKGSRITCQSLFRLPNIFRNTFFRDPSTAQFDTLIQRGFKNVIQKITVDNSCKPFHDCMINPFSNFFQS